MHLHFGEYVQWVTFKTTLKIDETWPEIMPFRPMVGDTIISADGLELKVVNVSIDFRRNVVASLYLPDRFNKLEDPLRAFYSWYNDFKERKKSDDKRG